MPNGGYVKENGISLCDGGPGSCHYVAETAGNEFLSPSDLYAKIGSSYDEAVRASLELGEQTERTA
jgi:hypothetical protein